jgi:hypothetical protein
MTSKPAVDLLLIVLEFVGLFATTWIAWFALVSAYNFWTNRTKSRRR